MKKATVILLTLVMAAVIATSVGAVTVTISGPSQVQDSILRGDWTNANIGQNTTDRQWRMFSDTAAVKRHNLVRFDLSGISAGATIVSATYGIYIRRYGGTVADITGYQISQLGAGKSWLEGTNDYADPAFAGDSTWNSQAHGSTLWATPGVGAGDIVGTTILWDQAGGLADVGWRTFDLTSMVQSWVSGAENNGLVNWGGSGGDNTRYNWSYDSDTSTEPGRVPYLTIEYTEAPVPEPSSLLAFGAFGIAGLGFMRRRRA